MISISLSKLILLFMIPGMISICLWWLIAVWKDRRQDKVMRQSMLRCRICGCAYPVAAEEISRCPSCQSLNRQEPQHQI